MSEFLASVTDRYAVAGRVSRWFVAAQGLLWKLSNTIHLGVNLQDLRWKYGKTAISSGLDLHSAAGTVSVFFVAPPGKLRRIRWISVKVVAACNVWFSSWALGPALIKTMPAGGGIFELDVTLRGAVPACLSNQPQDSLQFDSTGNAGDNAVYVLFVYDERDMEETDCMASDVEETWSQVP